MAKPSDSTLVIIPTFNERENLPLVVGRLRDAQPDVHILVVDDSSPDGTGDVADALAAEAREQIHVLHREGKSGLWGAYRAGFAWGLERDYRVLCEMDADGSHAPEQLQLLLDAIDDGAGARELFLVDHGILLRMPGRVRGRPAPWPSRPACASRSPRRRWGRTRARLRCSHASGRWRTGA